MARTLDFNRLERPTLLLVMPDKQKTKIKVTQPTEGLVEQLEATMPELKAALAKDDADAKRTVYDLAADLISCNTQGLQVTADDLRGKYKIGLEFLVAFYNAYLDFINEIHEIKN